jgi:hypothetical protein
MAKLAAYTPSTSQNVVPVAGWYWTYDESDPNGHQYAVMPANTISVTDAIWADTQGRVSGLYGVDQNAQKVVLMPALLTDEQAKKTQELSRAAAAQIAQGFTSSALGAAYTYPLGLSDQANLQAGVLRAQLPNPPATIAFMCADANGVWVRRPHDATQMCQAAFDGMAYVEAVLAKKDQFVATVQAATTIAAVQAVTWRYP